MYPWLVRAGGQTPFISAKVDLDRASFCRTPADGLPSEPRGGERGEGTPQSPPEFRMPVDCQ